MTSEPEQNLPSTPPTTPATPSDPNSSARQPRPPKTPTGRTVTLPANPTEAWDQIRSTAETTTQRFNEFRQRNQTRAEREKTARTFAERGREETGRGLRALAGAAGKLADLVDGKPEGRGQHAREQQVIEAENPGAGPDGRAY